MTDEIDGLFEDESEEAIETPEEVKVDESEPTAEKEPKLVPIAALLDERRKREEAKREADMLRSQIPKKETAPDPYEDLDAYNEYQRQKWEEEQLEKEKAELQERIEKSESQMLEQHEDYVQMKNNFLVLAQGDTNLTQQMVDHPDPAKFAYDKGKEYQDQIEKSAVERYLASQGNEESSKPEKSPVKAPSLASATAPTSSVEIIKETDLDEMFADQTY